VRVAGCNVHVFHADKTRAVFALSSGEPTELHAAHAGTVWACDAPRAGAAVAASESSGVVPAGSFVTCGSDNTARVWSGEGRQTGLVRAGATDEELLRVAPSAAAPGMPDYESGRPRGEHGLRALRLSEVRTVVCLSLA
jgi:hypothetical protein